MTLTDADITPPPQPLPTREDDLVLYEVRQLALRVSQIERDLAGLRGAFEHHERQQKQDLQFHSDRIERRKAEQRKLDTALSDLWSEVRGPSGIGELARNAFAIVKTLRK